MRSWIACSTYLILFLSLCFLWIGFPLQAHAQSLTSVANKSYQFSNFSEYYELNHLTYREIQDDTTDYVVTPGLPDPKSVMFKSMMIPGWGQIINKQAWKVPIVYGLLGGLGYYSVYLTKKYHDYQAAYYNLNPRPPNGEPPTDQRFGPTPSYIPEDANLQELRNQRNTYRNRRDLVYVGIVIAYGLNIVDAYVFAHMRSFDVSENLSMRPNIRPTMTAQATPGIAFSIDFITK